MKCPKCGKEMDPSWRCCLACGALNESNPANSSNDSIETLTLDDDVDNKDLSSNMTMYSVNFVLYIISLIALLVIKFNNVILDSFIYKFLIVTPSFFYLLCYQILLKKANLKWWGIFIPVYNLYLIFKMAYGNGWHFLTLFIAPILIVAGTYFGLTYDINITKYVNIVASIISIIVSISLISNIGSKFGKSGILTVLFTPIMIPYIAFSKKTRYYKNY